MHSFFNQSKIKPWIFLSLFIIVALILWNTNILFRVLKQEERTKMELWATAQQELIENSDLSRDYGALVLDVLQKTDDTPMILTNSLGNVKDFKNIDWDKNEDKDSIKLYNLLTQLKTENKPIHIQYKQIVNQKLYYGDSALLKKLQYYPLALLLIIGLFVAVFFFFFQTSRVSDQNRLWVSMAKETAHQIATPLSSLMGWTALFKEQKIALDSVKEIEKDIERLTVITDRFSNIGSSPELKKQDVVQATMQAIYYLKNRSSDQISWEWDIPEKEIQIPLNLSLYNWVMENLIKNGIDAMKGVGNISIRLVELEKKVSIQVSDSGQGIVSKNVKHIFRAGFTTKKTGWGFGLSLVKRIIVDYHKGSIEVIKTAVNQGTTFEIQFKK